MWILRLQHRMAFRTQRWESAEACYSASALGTLLTTGTVSEALTETDRRENEAG